MQQIDVELLSRMIGEREIRIALMLADMAEVKTKASSLEAENQALREELGRRPISESRTVTVGGAHA